MHGCRLCKIIVDIQKKMAYSYGRVAMKSILVGGALVGRSDLPLGLVCLLQPLGRLNLRSIERLVAKIK